MRRSTLLVCASCALALGAGFLGTGSAQADERSPFQLLGTAPVAASSGPESALQVTPVRWGIGWGGGSYRPYYGGYGSYYRPYDSYYRGGYGSSYYRGGYGGYGYRPNYNSYRPYGGGYYGYRPGIWFGF